MVYIPLLGSGTVSIIDTSLKIVTDTLDAGAGAFFSAFDPEEDKLYVSDCRENSVSVIDVNELKVMTKISGLSPYPFDLTFGP